MLDINRLLTVGHKDTAEFQKRKHKLSATLQLIMVCYEYLKSLHYSEGKISQLVKFHCR